MFIKYIVYIDFGFKTIQVKWIFEFVISNAHTTQVRIYGEPCADKFCAVDLFGNITRLKTISPVAKFHHVLGRGFMIQRVYWFLIKCLSANQNQLFYMKILYITIFSRIVFMGLNNYIDTRKVRNHMIVRL